MKTLSTRGELAEKEEKAASEIQFQKQLEKIYPTDVKIEIPMQFIDKRSNTFYDSDKAIVLKITVNSGIYPKEDVVTGIKLACQKVLECFH